MRSKLRWLVTILACMTTFAACATGSDDTRINIIIDADPEIRAATRSLLIEVYEGLGESLPMRNSGDKSLTRHIVSPATTTGGANGWPHTVTVSPLGGRVDPRVLVTVQALGSLPGQQPVNVVFAQELSRFWPKQTRELRIMLRAACRGVICEENQTCRNGTCEVLVEEGVDAGIQDSGTRDSSALDAGRIDAGRIDAGRVDANLADVGRTDANIADANIDASDANARDSAFDARTDSTIDVGIQDAGSTTTGRLTSNDRSCETLGGSGGVRSDWPARVTASLQDPDGASDLLPTALVRITPQGRSTHEMELPIMLVNYGSADRFGARVDIRIEDFVAAGSPSGSFWSVSLVLRDRSGFTVTTSPCNGFYISSN